MRETWPTFICVWLLSCPPRLLIRRWHGHHTTPGWTAIRSPSPCKTEYGASDACGFAACNFSERNQTQRNTTSYSPARSSIARDSLTAWTITVVFRGTRPHWCCSIITNCPQIPKCIVCKACVKVVFSGDVEVKWDMCLQTFVTKLQSVQSTCGGIANDIQPF